MFIVTVLGLDGPLNSKVPVSKPNWHMSDHINVSTVTIGLYYLNFSLIEVESPGGGVTS